jgi:S1-C subfamily serine protease
MRIDPNSPAARGGLEPGDVIVQIGKEAVKGAQDALRMLSKGATRPLRLRVIREGHGLFLILEPNEGRG